MYFNQLNNKSIKLKNNLLLLIYRSITNKSGKHPKSVSMNLLNTLNQDLKGYVISLKKDITEYHLPLYLAFKL